MTPPPTNPVTPYPNENFQTQWFHPRKAHVNMVGWTPSLEPPKFLKDDKNVSLATWKTPESVNARPCWHCGLGNIGTTNVNILRLSTSALAGDPDPNPRVFSFLIAILGSARFQPPGDSDPWVKYPLILRYPWSTMYLKVLTSTHGIKHK